MASRRVLKGVLANFLHTYASRYSDFDGYWLFGLVVEQLERLEVDLLQADGDAENIRPVEFARRLARLRFREQLAKVGLGLDRVKAAFLILSRAGDARPGHVNVDAATGWPVSCTARATTDLGRVFETTLTIRFVAPHDPAKEHWSGRKGSPRPPTPVQ